jgi:hypothetical protein
MYGIEGFFEVLAMAARSWVKANQLGDGQGWYFVIEDGTFRLL